jgi:Gas vesicle protein G
VGLIKELVLLPLAPVRFTVWVAEKTAEEADRQMFSTGAIARRLQEVEEALERGEIDEQQAEELEGEIIEERMSSA